MHAAAPDTPRAQDATGGGPAAASPPAGAPPGLLGSLRGLFDELPGLVGDRVLLLSLELKRASRALAQMVALVVAAAILLVTAWFALWAALAFAAIETGIAWGWVAAAVLLVNVTAAIFAVRHALTLARLVALPATVRRMTSLPSLPARGARAAEAAEAVREAAEAAAADLPPGNLAADAGAAR